MRLQSNSVYQMLVPSDKTRYSNVCLPSSMQESCKCPTLQSVDETIHDGLTHIRFFTWAYTFTVKLGERGFCGPASRLQYRVNRRVALLCC